MIVEISYSQRKNIQNGNILGSNLKDFIWSVDLNLKRNFGKEYGVSATFFPGRVIAKVKGVITPEILKQVAGSVEAIRMWAVDKKGYQLLVSIQ